MPLPSLCLHLITLAVADVARGARFYEALGMKRHLRGADGVAFFDARGVVISLYGRDDLAKDTGVADGRPGGITLAFNVASEAEVDAALDAAMQAGGRIVAAGKRAHWGGYIGFFADPDGHIWEVAHNPQFVFGERGELVLPE